MNERGVSMKNVNNYFELDDESTLQPVQGRLRYGVKKKPQVRRRPKVKRSSNDASAKRGMHQRRNKPMSW